MQRKHGRILAPLLLILAQAHAKATLSATVPGVQDSTAQLTGQLQDLRSNLDDLGHVNQPEAASTDLNDPALAKQQEAATASPKDEVEKELALVEDEAELAKQEPKSDDETELAKQEQKNTRFREILKKSMRYNKAMLKKVEVLRKQLKMTGEVAGKHIAQEQAKTAAEAERADMIDKQLQNQTRETNLRKRAMKIISTQLQGAQSQITELHDELGKFSTSKEELQQTLMENAELHHRLESEASSEASESKLLSATQQELEEAQNKIEELKQDESLKDIKLAKIGKQRNLLRKRQVIAERRDSIIHKQNDILNQELTGLNEQLQKNRANISQTLSKLQEAQSKVKEMSGAAGDMQQAQYKAENATKHTQLALEKSQQENKQLKMNNQLLEYQVNQQRRAEHTATQQLQEALRAEDAVKGVLARAQSTMMLSEGQYADGVQSLTGQYADGVQPQTAPLWLPGPAAPRSPFFANAMTIP